MSGRLLRGGLVVWVSACVATCGWTALATASIVHRYEPPSIYGTSTPAGTFRPFGLAIDNSTGASAGTVYAADPEQGVVDKFSASGVYEEQFGNLSKPFAVAVDNSSGLANAGVVYIADAGNGNIYKNGAVFATGMTGASSVAVNQATGDVYVTRGRSEEVAVRRFTYKFTSSGQESTPIEGFVGAEAVAVDNVCYYAGLSGKACAAADPSNEDVYVLDAGGGAVDKLEAGGRLLERWPVAGGVKGIAVDQSNGHVYVVNEGLVDEFNESGALLGTIGEESPRYPKSERKDGFADVSVAIARATGNVYIGDVSGNRVVDVFGPDLESPEAFTGGYVGDGPSAVTLQGEANPKGNDTTSFFEYGLCAGSTCTSGDPWESRAATVQGAGGPNPGSADDGAGTTNVPVQASISGLSSVPNQPYHYRLMAESSETGKSPLGNEREFRTPAVPPTVESLAPSAVAFASAVLAGALNPENSQTTYQFEYGPCGTPLSCSTSGYPSRTPAQTSAHYGTTGAFHEVIELSPSSVYHYRLVAENQACPAGASHPCPVASPEVVFTTQAAPPLEVVTGGTLEAATTSAVITGTVDPNGLASTYGFEIGTQPGVHGPPIGVGRIGLGVYAPVALSLKLDNLQPGVTYHYRVVAGNAYTTSYGTDGVLTTQGIPPVFEQPVAPVMLSVPAIGFGETTTPVVRTKTGRGLAAALRACAKKPKRLRAACRRKARRKYGGSTKHKTHKR